MTRVFIGELIPDTRPFPILNRHLGKEPYRGKKAYRAIFDEMDFSFIEIVQKPEDADFFLVPHNYFSIKDKTYLEDFIKKAKQYGKQVLLFAFGDNEADINVPDAIVFRYAGYRHKGIKKNEIIIPTQIYAGDILRDELFTLRDKTEMSFGKDQDRPTVSFCGWAGFNSWREWARNCIKNLPLNIRKYILYDRYADIYKRGMFWRKKAMRALKNSPLVRTSFIVRNFYSANKNTIQGDPAELRKEYIENIRNSDFVLNPRGDANMAARFYEALVLGRIPVIIDTGWLLPLEDLIDYKKFVVFVPHTDIKNTEKYIRKFWDAMSDAEFKEKQKLARETFMKYLKFDSFLRYMFENKLKQ